MPTLLRPQKGRFGLIDYEKIFCADTGGQNIYALRGIDTARGATVLVRPDHTVANILPLADTGEVEAFFACFMLEPESGAEPDGAYAP